MAKGDIIRSDQWLLSGDVKLRVAAELTCGVYQSYVQRLSGIVLTHWSSIGRLSADEQPLAVERLFNRTKANPKPIYARFFESSAAFAKFPSYLRRAAIRAAVGQVSSFLTRYDSWQSHNRRHETARPPTFGKPRVNPVLYTAKGGAGAMVSFEGDAGRMKLWNGADWIWFSFAVVQRGKRHQGTGAGVLQSPTLKVVAGRVTLTQPFQMPRYCRLGNSEVVCSVDLGINNRAVAAIVGSDGAVHGRAFFTRSKHDDRRDKAAQAIRGKARRTMGGKASKAVLTPEETSLSAAVDGLLQAAWDRVLMLAGDLTASAERLGAILGEARREAAKLVNGVRIGQVGSKKTGKLSKGFCSTLYARIRGLNRQIASDTARAIMDFASAKEATVIVFEKLKGWRPKAGRPGTVTKSKFHYWLHRLLVRQVEASWTERGGRVAHVNPWGTSAWAYDGSGKVVRPAGAHDQAIFTTGKRYHADLNAAYNIGAKYWVSHLEKDPDARSHLDRLLAGSSDEMGRKTPVLPVRRKKGGASPGRSVSRSRGPRLAPRAPATLSTLWLLAKAMQGETPTTDALAA